MIVVIQSGTSAAEMERVSKEICNWNITPENSALLHKVVIGLVGDATEAEG